MTARTASRAQWRGEGTVYLQHIWNDRSGGYDRYEYETYEVTLRGRSVEADMKPGDVFWRGDSHS